MSLSWTLRGNWKVNGVIPLESILRGSGKDSSATVEIKAQNLESTGNFEITVSFSIQLIF